MRIRGALTITRAASLQREIDGEADPLVFDLGIHLVEQQMEQRAMGGKPGGGIQHRRDG